MTIEEQMCAQAIGCSGAGAYKRWAAAEGYPYCEVYDWTSSAGDWTFIVSKDGETWHPMFQSNNYPNAGFTRTVDTTEVYRGTADEVTQEIWNQYS